MTYNMFNSYRSCLPAKGRVHPGVSTGLSQGRHIKSNIHSCLHSQLRQIWSSHFTCPQVHALSVGGSQSTHRESFLIFYFQCAFLVLFCHTFPSTCSGTALLFCFTNKTWRLGVKWTDSRGSNFTCIKVGTSFKIDIAYTRASPLIWKDLRVTHEACDELLPFL